jgi:predicted RNA binding protein YcfA (HicA-like mRNA interferase family)
MPKLPKAREVVRVAKKLGFVFSRQQGSHAVYRRPNVCGDLDRTTIPVHGGTDIQIKTFNQICADMGITRDKFWELK